MKKSLTFLLCLFVWHTAAAQDLAVTNARIIDGDIAALANVVLVIQDGTVVSDSR